MDKLEIAKEAAIIYFEENISAAEAIEKVKEKYLDTDQSIQGTNLRKMFWRYYNTGGKVNETIWTNTKL